MHAWADAPQLRAPEFRRSTKKDPLFAAMAAAAAAAAAEEARGLARTCARSSSPCTDRRIVSSAGCI